MATFTFTRFPGVKVRVETSLSGLVQADSTLTLIGRIGATAGTAVVGHPLMITNFGDPVAAAVECTTLFGAGSELGEMVLAAINAVLYTDNQNISFPKIQVLPLANGAVDTDLAALLPTLLSTPMPYIAMSFSAADTVAMTALKNFVTAISKEDRGLNGQFGSFGFAATPEPVSNATAEGLAAAYEGISIVNLRDTATTLANKTHQAAAAYAAINAGNALPFMPLDGTVIGGLVAPSQATDWHTAGDTGSASLLLDAGVVPLMINASGQVTISRSVTTRRPTSAIEEVAYFDIQDWQVLYYIRKNIYALATQPRYKIAKATDMKIQALRSEIISLLKDLEKLEMVQYVEQFLPQITAARSPLNRSAAVYSVPMNIVPGLHNIGVDLIGTSTFDTVA